MPVPGIDLLSISGGAPASRAGRLDGAPPGIHRQRMPRTQIYQTGKEGAGLAVPAGATGKIIRETIDACVDKSRPAALETAIERCRGLWRA